MSSRPGDRAALAITIFLVSLVLFDFMGLLIKELSDRYAAAELSAYRNLFGLIPSTLFLLFSRAWHATGRKMYIRQWRLAIVRGLMVTLAQLLYYFSLGALAFATATTISYSNAIFMTALAVPLLGEKVGWVRWSAVLLGFFGVVLIVGPASIDFGWAALTPLGAALLYALNGITARMMDDEVPSPLLNLYSAGVAVVGSVLLVLLLGGFSPIKAPIDLLYIAGMGAFGGMAVLCMVVSYRMTEQSNLAPFSYFGIPTAFFFGWLFFEEAPWDALFPGALLIALGGLLVVWRERRMKARVAP
ncbi:DMT family transporter [Albibacillus kandeliae]|uniref:DMT family transporter n=1 Tax=Albibacillus kandeliae TaxID=2174228 RepID=UPI000D685947|nr:DMT family transporter [Albibacillus kandeliae]